MYGKKVYVCEDKEDKEEEKREERGDREERQGTLAAASSLPVQ